MLQGGAGHEQRQEWGTHVWGSFLPLAKAELGDRRTTEGFTKIHSPRPPNTAGEGGNQMHYKLIPPPNSSHQPALNPQSPLRTTCSPKQIWSCPLLYPQPST